MMWSLLDTGVRTAAENIALDELLLELRNANKIPNIVRFLQFSNPAVLVGYHQLVEEEARLDFCRQRSIELNRRLTGGGAIYVDRNQLGWEVVAAKSATELPLFQPALYKKMCTAVITGLKSIGIEAVYKGRNDIEINGKKISGTGGTELENAILFQGTLLADVDITNMLKALKIPAVKLKSHEVRSVKERVTSLKTVLGHKPAMKVLKKVLKEGFEKTFGITLVPMDSVEFMRNVRSLYKRKVRSMESHYWIYRRKPIYEGILTASRKTFGGLVTVSIRPEHDSIKDILICGDFFINPPTAVLKIENALRNSKFDIRQIKTKLQTVFDNNNVSALYLTANDFADVIADAIQKIDICNKLKLSHTSGNKINVVNKRFADFTKPSVLLLPYCAKKPSCKYRWEDKCVMCGGCTAGTAYKIAEQNGMRVFSILSFEHFIETLHKLNQAGIKEYIGCCCTPFLTKHFDEITATKQAGVFIDIDSKTCYELGKQTSSYSGKFMRQTHLNLKVLDKVINYFFKNAKKI